MEIQIGCIVEGHGEVEAVPTLIRRLAGLSDPSLFVHIPQPLRIPKSTLLRSGELERAVELAARKVAPRGAILVLLDSDEQCPARLGPELLSRARRTRDDLPIAVVLAKREFEAWFLAAAESLRGKRGLAEDLTGPSSPEEISGAKEWLSRHMSEDRSYSATIDQPALTAVFDIDQAHRADSFDKLHREVQRLVVLLQHPSPHP